MGLSVYVPVMHETGVANGSPSDKNGNACQLVIDHFAELHRGDGVCFGFAAQRDAHNELVVTQIDGSGRCKLRLINGMNGVKACPLLEVVRGFLIEAVIGIRHYRN